MTTPAATSFPASLRPLVRPVADLIPDDANARLHPVANLAAIKNSLRRFGQQRPILAQRRADGSLVVRAGNGTLAAAIALGWDRVAVVETTLSDSEAVAYGIADNRSAELAAWNEPVLLRLLEEVAQDDDPGLLEAAGFSMADIAKLTADQAGEDRDLLEDAEDEEPGGYGEGGGPSRPSGSGRTIHFSEGQNERLANALTAWEAADETGRRTAGRKDAEIIVELVELAVDAAASEE